MKAVRTPHELAPSLRCDHAWFRTPLLPADALPAIEGRIADDRDLRAWHDHRRAEIRRLLERPEVAEALFVASPSLATATRAWLREPECPTGHRTELSLVRYLQRMSTRATPLGLCAGVSVATLGPTTSLRLADTREARRHTRIDGGLVTQLTAILAANRTARAHLPHRRNDTAFVLGGRLRYAEMRLVGAVVVHRLATVDTSDVLDDLLAAAVDGRTPSALVDDLALAHPEFDRAALTEFVEAAIDEQLLVPELAPAATAVDPLGELSRALAPARDPAIASIRERLDRVRTMLEALDAAGLGASADAYAAIGAELDGLGMLTETERWWQVDLAKPTVANSIGPAIVSEAEAVVRLLHRVAPSASQDSFEEFKRAFEERYGEREVPLLEVLDDEVGIGFASAGSSARDVAPLLEGIPIANRRSAPPAFTRRDVHLLRRLERLGADQELVLTEDDLRAMESPQPRPAMARSLAVMLRVAADSPEDIDRGAFTLCFDHASGPSGTRIGGRFGHVSPELAEAMRHHHALEDAAHPNVIVAEVVHHPEGRVNNIISRPSLRPYELPILGRSAVDREHTIELSDLWVGIRHGKVVLLSRRLGAEVVPRLSTAHNFTIRGLNVYRFLCALQGQDVAALYFHWGPLAEMRSLPRVRFGRTILAVARWRITGPELQPLLHARRGLKSARDAAELRRIRLRTFEAMQGLREAYRLPRFVQLVEHDHCLAVDLDDPMSVDAFAGAVKGDRPIDLEEQFPARDQLVVRGPEGRFHAELVLAFHTAPPPESEPSDARPAPPRTWARRNPGSSWAYAKLYAGPSSLDDLLVDAVAPWLRRTGVDRWFFVRYADPHWHLRLRVHDHPSALQRRIVPSLWEALEPWTREGIVWRLQVDTYDPEVDRYGGPELLEAAEVLFHADSERVLDVLAVLDDEHEIRWLAALRSVDDLLGGLGLSLEQRLQCCSRARAGFGREFGESVELRRALGERWRRERARIEPLLHGDTEDHPVFATLRHHEDRLRAAAEPIAELVARGRSSQPLDHLAHSFVHMHVNRLLRSRHRAHELVLLDLLVRSYRARCARR